MPEQPEVESIKLKLQKYLVGHSIEEVEIRLPKIFTGNPKNIEGVKVKKVRRFAKVLSIDLSNDYSIVIHIKLTGQLIYRGPNLKSPPNLSPKVIGGLGGKHTHVIFHLDRGGKLYYNDLRRFGWIKIIKSDEVEKTGFVGKLGPEPFKDLTFEKFRQIISKSSRPIKTLLMDQEKMSGVGNIYANDALWLAKINPKVAANQLTSKQAKPLFSAIEEVLKRGLKWGGASELMYVTSDGTEGNYQEHTLVYGREGEPCERCHKAKIQKFFLSGRGTYWCPVCQK